MEALVLIQLYKSTLLADLAAVTVKDANQLAVIEHTFNLAASAADLPVEETRWTLWRHNPQDGHFESSAPSLLSLPVATALAAALGRSHLIVAAEINKTAPAFLARAALRDTSPPAWSDADLVRRPVRLPQNEVEKIELPPADIWNTTTLPCPEWLFNPSVTVAPTDGSLSFAFNTADASAVIFSSGPEFEAVKFSISVPALLEPTLQKLGKRTLLFGRQPTLPWSVFFHSVRHSGQFGPVPLPLQFIELDDAGKTVGGVNLSRNQQVGDIFAYAIASNPARDLLLAVVTGTKAAPKLRLYLSHDVPERFTLLAETDLPAVPRRVAVAVSSKNALVGVVIRGTGGDEVHAQSIKIGN